MKTNLFHNNQILLFALVLLFALAPCKVKASLFETLGFTFEQTLNQSKATSNCNSSNFIAQKVSSAKVNSFIIPNNVAVKNFFLLERKVVELQILVKFISVQRPPKYILYKQFKFDVV